MIMLMILILIQVRPFRLHDGKHVDSSGEVTYFINDDRTSIKQQPSIFPHWSLCQSDFGSLDTVSQFGWEGVFGI